MAGAQVLRAIQNPQRAINRFRERLAEPASASAFLAASPQPIVTRTAFRTNSVWDSYIDTIVAEVNSHPYAFLRCEAVSRTMHPPQNPTTLEFLKECGADPRFQAELLPRLCDPPMGNPHLCSFFPLASPTTVAHARHLLVAMSRLGFSIADLDAVLEIGGGYGNTCRILKSWGFRGDYTIFDIPEMLQLQTHYLRHVLQRPEDARAIRSLDAPTAQPRNNGLLIASFSLNEMPVDLRREIETAAIAPGAFKYLLIQHNQHFEGVDNVAYFADMAQRLGARYEVTHFKDHLRGMWYLLGRRKV